VHCQQTGDENKDDHYGNSYIWDKMKIALLSCKENVIKIQTF